MKIFEEHEGYLKQNITKSFIYKIFEKNDAVPIIKNDFVKNKFLNGDNTYTNNTNFVSLRDFYQSVYRNDGNFWNDFNKYLNFQLDPKQKNKENQFKLDEFTNKMSKLFQGSLVHYYKFYTRNTPVRKFVN